MVYAIAGSFVVLAFFLTFSPVSADSEVHKNPLQHIPPNVSGYLMRETVNIENPNGILKLKGSKYDSILYLNNIPIQFTWLREIGSTWRYQISKSIEEADIIKDNSFRNYVKFGYLSNELLSKQFEYILKTLSTGTYELTIDYLSQDLYLIENEFCNEGYCFFDTYGGSEDIIETQYSLNENLILDYITLIEKGVEPIMIVLTSIKSRNRFIIDGHHKFYAYSRLKMNPKSLIITKVESDTILQDEAMKIFVISNCKNQEYKMRYLDK